ncbi:MAG TPA: DUF4149 domain-containing protein [Burkholderiaceae bacterium]
MLVERARLLIATFWVGSLWAIGYLAAPTLFATLYDKVLAGTVAGSLFRTEAWASVTCAVLLLALQIKQRRLVLAMLACTLIGYFCLQPFMSALRESAGPGGVMASDAKTRFAVLHGISMVIYLAQSVLGAVMICRLVLSAAKPNAASLG